MQSKRVVFLLKNTERFSKKRNTREINQIIFFHEIQGILYGGMNRQQD